MRHSAFSRCAAALSGALLLQLSLLASGTVCGMGHGDHAAPAGMSMPAMDHAQHAAHASHAAPGSPVLGDAPSDACHTTGLCGAPWAPGGGCDSATSCTTAVTAVLTAEYAALSVAPERVAAVRSIDTPLGPAFAPELPPPRA